jgi:CheY-like chemotaxis protein
MNPEPFLILHVEDDPNDVLFFREACRKAALPCEFEVVADGELAIAYLRGAEQFGDRQRYPFPNLLLLDLKIPRKTGFEVLEWVRSQPSLSVLPVIIFTSSTHEGDMRRAYGEGANSFLVKPVIFEELMETAKAIHLYWSRMNRTPALPFLLG